MLFDLPAGCESTSVDVIYVSGYKEKPTIRLFGKRGDSMHGTGFVPATTGKYSIVRVNIYFG